MSKADTASEFIESLPIFISEAAEQLEAMEALLLEIEESPSDTELLNSLFRCAHTVKGSAGLFGLNRVVEFTHHVETLLDKMREGHIVFTPAIGTLLLECNDQIKYLVGLGFDEESVITSQQDHRQGLVSQLKALTSAPSDVEKPRPDPLAVEAGPPEKLWTISAQFGPETFRSGMDPLSVCQYLQTMGTQVSVQWNTDAVPALNELVHDTCYTSFVLELQSAVKRPELEDAFSFVEDDCKYQITERETQHTQLKRSIEDFPEVPRLGDMLVSIGALTRSEVDDALESQAQGGSDAHHKSKLGALLVEQTRVNPDLVNVALGKQQKIRDKQTGDEGRFIRVQADRLDTVINLLGELVIAGAGTGAALGSFENKDETSVETLVETLTEFNQNMNRLIEEIRNSTLALRMVPIGDTFTRFKRVVRDTASSLGKEVDFVIAGGETELDKSMVEKIADPLMHLVRNSLDHGLEPPQERVDKGKSQTGHLQLSARHEAGAILIRIEDDGRGINRDRVLQRAWDKGLVERGVTPSDDAINMLIFEPGFSTAEQVTNLSGRGVGMDVVRSNIEALRGTLKLESDPGRGLRVDIRLPLTLAIIDGFLVGVGESKYVLPLESVVEVIESGRDTATFDASGRHCVELREAVLPVVRLSDLYDIEPDPESRGSIVVVQSSVGLYGVEVDTLYGQHQTVIKPLGQLFKTLRGISGSAILGSGVVALIIDVTTLGQLTAGQAHSATQSPAGVRQIRNLEPQSTLGEPA